MGSEKGTKIRELLEKAAEVYTARMVWQRLLLKFFRV